jgi:hypothetical protein
LLGMKRDEGLPMKITQLDSQILYYISYYIILHYIIWYHIKSYHIILYYIISSYIISYYIISYHLISYHIISYYIYSMYSQYIFPIFQKRGRMIEFQVPPAFRIWSLSISSLDSSEVLSCRM